MDWRMSEAEGHLGEVIDRALSEGPQKIVRAEDAVVVVRAEEYERLVKRRSPLKSLLFDGPSLHGLDLTRDRSSPREIDFGDD